MAGFRVKRVGYFGKMPKSGDFVSRNIDSTAKDGFDRWLQESIGESRSQLKEAWLGAFLTAPVWRFLLLGQLGTSLPLLGVMIPSVDKVGRYFPLAVLIELADVELGTQDLAACDALLQEFEDLLLGVLSEDFDQDFFDYRVGVAARKISEKAVQSQGDIETGPFGNAEWLERQLVDLRSLGGSIWWTEGSDSRLSDVLTYRAMPASTVFASFLRDPNHFRDLEWAWDAARDINTTQQDNSPVDLSDNFEAATFHLISHRGTDHARHNTCTATFSAQHQTLLISDGRFATGHFAMASRVLGGLVPAKLSSTSQGETELDGVSMADQELDRITSFFATKFVGIPMSTLASPLSFACLSFAKAGGAGTRLIVAGDYLCLHKGRHGVSKIFGARHSGDDPTIRQNQTGHCKSVALTPEPGDRLLLCNSAFDSIHFKDDIYEAFASPRIDQFARSLWQNATIKGLPGNIVLAAIEFTHPADSISELKP